MASLMKTSVRRVSATLALGALTFGVMSHAHALSAPAAHLTRAPLEQYLMANPAGEIALARSAAPAAISSQAEVLTLGAQGYQIAVKGHNGFVCLVLRGWTGDFNDPDFWNPKVRAPICYNAVAARSVLLNDLRRTGWALAGVSRTEMINRTRAAIASHVIVPPPAGAMSYMMSRNGYLSDRDGHWHPHLMFFLPRTPPSEWGANVPGGVVMGAADNFEPVTVFFVPLPHWSDGTPAPPNM